MALTNITKIILIFTIVLSMFSSDVLSMKEDAEKTPILVKPISAESCWKRAENSHWGLSHWASGIKEYMIDRCMIGVKEFNEVDTERAYILRREISSGRYDITKTTDCYCVGCCAYLCDNNLGVSSTPDACLAATLCCPLASIIHLLCLPFELCHPSPNTHTFTSTYITDRERKNEECLRADIPRKEKEAINEKWKVKNGGYRHGSKHGTSTSPWGYYYVRDGKEIIPPYPDLSNWRTDGSS